jgi:hypothetical protein
MTTASEPGPGPDPRSDGSTELDQRATLQLLLTEPSVRNYAIAAFSALAIVALLLMEEGADIGGALIAIVGVSGVIFRWTFAPVFVLVFLTYFMWTPTGIPGYNSSYPFMIEGHRFDFADVLLVFSVLVYFISQYRLYGLTYQAIAFEGTIRRTGEPPTRRPPSLIRPTEIATTLAIAFALVIVGQLIWWFASSLQISTSDGILLQPVESQSMKMKRLSPVLGRGPTGRPVAGVIERDELLPPGLSRFYILIGLVFMGTLGARGVFAYWRLKRISPDEAKMTLLDVSWLETHRERVRVEKWRIWGRKRAESHRESVRVEKKRIWAGSLPK